MTVVDTAVPNAKGRRCVFPMSRIKLEEPGADGKRRIQGYASVFGNRDSYGDIVVKGAFERTLREKPDVKVLYQHDARQPIGKQEAAYENEYGLVVTGVMTETALFKDTVLPLLLDGVLTGLSIGYDIVKGESSEEGYLLQDIDLWEWSPVTFPANELAAVTEVKTLGDTRTNAHHDRLLRAAGQLEHELAGYFAEDSVRWEGVDLAPLVSLHSRMRGTLAERGVAAADAENDVEHAYLSGFNDALDLIKTHEKE